MITRKPVLAWCLALVCFAAASPGAWQGSPRTIYVTVLDGKGVPVPDLTAADFVVKEDGKARDIVTAAVSTTPMQIALMLDDSGLALGAIRQGAGQFIQTLQGKADFKIITIGGRNLTLVDYTRDPRPLYEGLQKMLTRNASGTYLLDGFVEVTQTFLTFKAPRPVIVAVATEGEDFSNVRPEVVLDAIQKSSARLYYIGLGPPVTQGNRPAYTAERNADSTVEEAGNKNTVLGAAPKNSGGRSDQALQPSGVTAIMKQIADELAGQYQITYTSDAAEAKLSVETTRKNVKLRAPARVGSR